MTAALARISEENRDLNSICTLVAEQALHEACAADRRLAQGMAARPLEGVPFTAKDLLATEGVRTTLGSDLFADWIPASDAVSVARLKHAGAILVGKTNTPEFGSDPFCNTWNRVFGATRNPWDVNRTCGGSSGGAAASVAAGLVPLALGTDLGGSIRGPAAFCGVAGMRPTPGLVPTWPDDVVWGMPVEQVVGPIAADTESIGLALSVLAGPDHRAPVPVSIDRPSLNAAASGQWGPVERLRIGVCADFGGQLAVPADIADAVSRAAALLTGSVGMVRPVSLPMSTVAEMVRGTRALTTATRLVHLRALRGLSPRAEAQLEAATGVGVAEIARAEWLRSSFWRQMVTLFDALDVVVCPTWPVTPFRLDVPLAEQIGADSPAGYFDYVHATYAFTLVGLPSISVPCGFDDSGMPVGMQIAGRPGADATVLAVSAAFERARGPFPAPPHPALRIRAMHDSFAGAENAWLPFQEVHAGQVSP